MPLLISNVPPFKCKPSIFFNTKGQLFYSRSKLKADKCQLSSSQGELDICPVTIITVGITYCNCVLWSWNAETTEITDYITTFFMLLWIMPCFSQPYFLMIFCDIPNFLLEASPICFLADPRNATRLALNIHLLAVDICLQVCFTDPKTESTSLSSRPSIMWWRAVFFRRLAEAEASCYCAILLWTFWPLYRPGFLPSRKISFVPRTGRQNRRCI